MAVEEGKEEEQGGQKRVSGGQDRSAEPSTADEDVARDLLAAEARQMAAEREAFLGHLPFARLFVRMCVYLC